MNQTRGNNSDIRVGSNRLVVRVEPVIELKGNSGKHLERNIPLPTNQESLSQVEDNSNSDGSISRPC